MTYSRETDGLRAISVILVIVFHSNSAFLPGGFIGVDVFFVISGFLITSLIKREVDQTGRFSFVNFYKRRFARLLPALILMLVAVFIYGALLYGPATFDSLGRDIFFSSLGVKNFLDATGVNYFVQEEKHKPLLHMWSLGVEEQFYAVWPLLLMVITLLLRKFVFPIAVLLLFLSLAVSEAGVRHDALEAYFLPQFRAVELLIGAVAALYLVNGRRKPEDIPLVVRSVLSILSIIAIFAAAFVLDAGSMFPGVNSLFVTIPAIILVTCSEGTPAGWLLSRKILVGLGLISYPLYLYHQPLISALLLHSEEMNRLLVLAITVTLGSLLAYGTYVFAEIPVRRRAKAKGGTIQAVVLVFATVTLAGIGLVTAKSGGFPQRLAILNPYAESISEGVASTFHKNFRRGIHIGNSVEAKILFVGDSLLQQYVVPLARHWGYDREQIDVISRGGCILLSGVEYQDGFADISCDSLRDSVFESDATYDRIIISQGWHLYSGRILNAFSQEDPYQPETWKPFIAGTVKHLAPHAKEVIIIGPHPVISSECSIDISLFTTRESVADCLEKTRIDYSSFRARTEQFAGAMADLQARMLLPMDLWCDRESESCATGKDGVPWFKDKQHFGSFATAFLLERMAEEGW